MKTHKHYETIYRAHLNKLEEYAEKEAYYAKHPEARPIQSNDADPVESLQAKLDAIKEAHEQMKPTNKILRKKPIDTVALVALLGEEKAKEVLEPDCFGGIGFAHYDLTNSLAEIKRLEGRIKEIETRKNQGNKEIEINGGVKVLQNSEKMRIQIFFEDKPDEAMRKVLKSNAFKWAPSEGAWQRQLTNNAIYSFKHYVMPELKKMGA